jgi:hypothetical protein
VQKLWDKGLLLASLATGASLFPRRLILKKPSSTQLVDRFEDVRTWIADLRKGTNYRVVMRDLLHHIIGTNSVPDEIWIDTVEDALSLIGKSRGSAVQNCSGHYQRAPASVGTVAVEAAAEGPGSLRGMTANPRHYRMATDASVAGHLS